ncbi:MAG: hypothetical protein E7254_01870 [Lachnospiraceae bacterium]|nr:hypothetical protein [Lachnospiraceae bacterium]
MDIKIIIKSMGSAFFIPFIINDVVIPLIVLGVKLNGSEYNVDQSVYMTTQMFTPFLASLWIYLHLTKYIDVKGNENYYIKNRSKLSEVLKLYVVYIATNTIFFVWYSSINKKYILEWLHIIIMSFVFVAAAYFFSYLFRSISLALIPSFLYLIATITELNPTFSKISFYEYDGMTDNQLFSKYILFVIIAIFLMGIGNILNKNFREYNL